MTGRRSIDGTQRRDVLNYCIGSMPEERQQAEADLREIDREILKVTREADDLRRGSA